MSTSGSARTVTAAVTRAACLMGWISLLITSVALAAGPGGEGKATEPRVSGTRSDDTRVILYYFHGDRRCRTCRNIESFAEETVRTRFGKQLRSGELEWKVVNIDKPRNEHFVKDFALPSSSLVIAEVNDRGVVRHEILQEVWLLVSNKGKYESYVARALQRYLG